MALHYEFERAIAEAEKAGNQQAVRFLRDQYRRFREAFAGGLVKDLSREAAASIQNDGARELTPSSQPYELAKIEQGPVFTPQTASAISGFLELTDVMHEMDDENGVYEWLFKRGLFEVHLIRQDPTPTRFAGEQTVFVQSPEPRSIDGFATHSMEGVTRIMIQPTMYVSEGGVLFLHEVGNLSIGMVVRKDGRANFHVRFQKY